MTLRVLISALLATTVAHAGVPTNQADTMFAPILRTERAGAGVVRIVYDLRGVVGTAFAVTLEASDDGGQTFTVRPQALTGDVGPRVSPGAEKMMVWDSTKDVDDLQVDRYVFRVRVSATGPDASVASPPGGTTAAPAGRGAAGAPSSAGTTAAQKGGLGKGAIFGIVGGATAAGVGVAVIKGGSSGNPSGGPGAPPGVVSSAVIDATPPSGTGIRAVTNYTFAGSAPNITSGTFEWDFGDGVSGSGQTTTHVYGSNGTFRVTLKITVGSQQLTGSATVVVGDLTGTWIHGIGADIGETTLVMVQQGTTVSGQYRHRVGGGVINTVPFRGTLSSPRSIDLVEEGECLAVQSGVADSGLTRISTQGSYQNRNCFQGPSAWEYVRQ